MKASAVVDVDVLIAAIKARADAVPLGATYHGGPLDGAPIYDVHLVAIRLIRKAIADSDAETGA